MSLWAGKYKLRTYHENSSLDCAPLLEAYLNATGPATTDERRAGRIPAGDYSMATTIDTPLLAGGQLIGASGETDLYGTTETGAFESTVTRFTWRGAADEGPMFRIQGTAPKISEISLNGLSATTQANLLANLANRASVGILIEDRQLSPSPPFGPGKLAFDVLQLQAFDVAIQLGESIITGNQADELNGRRLYVAYSGTALKTQNNQSVNNVVDLMHNFGVSTVLDFTGGGRFDFGTVYCGAAGEIDDTVFLSVPVGSSISPNHCEVSANAINFDGSIDEGRLIVMAEAETVRLRVNNWNCTTQYLPVAPNVLYGDVRVAIGSWRNAVDNSFECHESGGKCPVLYVWDVDPQTGEDPEALIANTSTGVCYVVYCGGTITNTAAPVLAIQTWDDGVLIETKELGTGGSVATDAIFNAAGDLVYGTGSDTATRLAVGTAGQVLNVNAGATAPAWTSAINSVSVGSTDPAAGYFDTGFRFYKTGNPGDSNTEFLNLTTDAANFYFLADQSGTGSHRAFNLGTQGDAPLRFRTGGTSRWDIVGSTGHLLPITDSTYNIGASGTEVAAIFTDTLTLTGAITFPDGVKQTFNPNGTNAGINVGSHTTDPSSLANGDIWYDSTANELTARINGASVVIGTSGSAAVATDTIWDAAGDLVQGTGANTSARLAIGTAGQLLRVNSGATAVEWATVGGTGTMTTVKENDSAVGTTDAVAVDFLGADFDVTATSTDRDVVIAAALTRDAEWDTFTKIFAAASGEGTGVATAFGNAVDASGGFVTYDAELAALRGLTSAADKLPYFTGSGTAALADLGSAARAILDGATSAEVAALVSNETGSGVLTFATAPTFTTSITVTNANGSAILTGTAIQINDDTSDLAWAFDAAGGLRLLYDGALQAEFDSGGDLAIEGSLTVGGSAPYLVGGADVPVADGGTGASDASGARTNLGLVIGTNVQAFDADLTTYAGATPGTGVATALAVNVGTAGAFVTNGGALGTPSSGTLTNCTGLPIAGLTSSTSTAVGVGTIELGHASDTTLARAASGQVSVEGVNLLRTTEAFTSSTTTSGDISPALTGFRSFYERSAQAAAITINNPTGSPVAGWTLMISLKDNGTTRAITWDTKFRNLGGTMPTTTTVSKWHTVGFKYNSVDDKWDCIGATVQP